MRKWGAAAGDKTERSLSGRKAALRRETRAGGRERSAAAWAVTALVLSDRRRACACRGTCKRSGTWRSSRRYRRIWRGRRRDTCALTQATCGALEPRDPKIPPSRFKAIDHEAAPAQLQHASPHCGTNSPKQHRDSCVSLRVSAHLCGKPPTSAAFSALIAASTL